MGGWHNNHLLVKQEKLRGHKTFYIWSGVPVVVYKVAQNKASLENDQTFYYFFNPSLKPTLQNKIEVYHLFLVMAGRKEEGEVESS